MRSLSLLEQRQPLLIHGLCSSWRVHVARCPVHPYAPAVIYEEGDEDFDYKQFLVRPLQSVGGGGIHDGTLVSVTDFSQV